MSENTHPIPAAWLAAYYDGELEPAHRALVEAHLPTCAECQDELAALRSLSEALAADELDSQARPDAAAFWQALEPRLPNRTPATASIAASQVLLRWLPGVSLLVFNSALQASALAATALMFWLPRGASLAAWSQSVNRLATGVTMGWLAWFWPAEWSALGVFLAITTLSASLTVVYLAWLAYEWRYGVAASRQAAT
jgi:anti-sigma factor RsiW